ncbi:uncharacterized protein Z520_02757 [Fonsecaea multimorphosa CBS 102226]|uniref:Rhomboid-type serine protease n=1 Tax=Fonsecaea multimorphosa CBS 102226 TaxID=1442371 RepID=A0A0D2KDB7_9EURO|nr:uncharacterized protein Z520_02757 [Fonsecaea multimorphosa CBS 102226]KIY01205.1 hypothetical protein Z520_02757 [Fonsecaea multimorphosa CBS 102226]OAL28816.1 hypothetical protein AYO22_02681 [Fonsecaea multimorphosa]
MAADDYYQESHMAQSSQSTRPQNERPVSHIAFAYNPKHSSSSLDQSRLSQAYNTRPMSTYYEPHDPTRQSVHSDSIPLKHQSRINTTQDAPDWRNQSTQYPPSPESNSPPLLPDSKGRRKIEGSFANFFKGKIPWVVYTLSLIQITVFVVEIIKNSIITGSPIMIKPQFNPMIGPSTYVQINMGARFVPCMRTTPGVQDSPDPPTWPCPNTTTSDPNSPSNHCDLKALCGFSGFSDEHPNQWFRFIIPMFLHAGLIHIAFNLLLQLTMGREMEKAIGSIRFAIVYFSSGIFGFVLGGNFAATAIASTGASGCLFGILALVLLDLIYGWNERRHPVKDLMWIMVDIIISFVLGLLPGLDNFSHIGGFLMGLAAGICLLHSPNILRQRIGESTSLNTSPYRNVGSDADVSINPKDPMLAHSSSSPIAPRAGPATTAAPANVAAFAKQPVGFFKGRKPLWWAWWLFRLGALIGVLVAFVVLLNNFYKYRDTCSWCKYLSCLPINNWCEIGNLQLSNATSNSTNNLSRRTALSVIDAWEARGSI